MRKTILTVLGSALLITATVQLATAAEHKGRKPVRAPATEQFRNSNATLVAPQAEPDWSRYYDGYSAPAGR